MSTVGGPCVGSLCRLPESALHGSDDSRLVEAGIVDDDVGHGAAGSPRADTAAVGGGSGGRSVFLVVPPYPTMLRTTSASALAPATVNTASRIRFPSGRNRRAGPDNANPATRNGNSHNAVTE